MNFLQMLSTSDVSAAPEGSASMHPAFLVIVGLVAVGFVIMIIQNFVIKKEEHYK